MSTLVVPLGATLSIVKSGADGSVPSPGSALPNERELVEQARVDINAFGLLYRHFLPRIHAFAWRRTGSVEAAEDISSATFEAALRNINSFQWRSGGMAPWLFRIAANQVVAHYRTEGRPAGERGQLAMARLHESEAPDELVHLFNGDTERLRSALDGINARYQKAVSLRYLADLEPEDAAVAMGLNKKAYAVILSRGMKALRRELEALEALSQQLSTGESDERW